jgi:hypothetical protein
LLPGSRANAGRVLEGIVLGEDEDLSPGLRDAFRASGLYHLQPDSRKATRDLSISEDEREAALRLLYQDAMRLYERARDEVTIQWSDGRTGPYVAVRYKQAIEKTQDNKALLVPTIARIVKKRTIGFGHLEAANRPDLMVETLVLDTTKPYHRFFTSATIDVARQRLQQHGHLAGSDS